MKFLFALIISTTVLSAHLTHLGRHLALKHGHKKVKSMVKASNKA